MPPTRKVRWLFTSMFVAALVVAAMGSSASAAPGWGDLGRFGGVDKSKKGHKFLLEEAHAFGIDSGDNTVYVGDELKEAEENHEFRLQKYGETGESLAEVVVNKGQKEPPSGMEAIEDLEGVAIDPAEKRLYVLVSYRRSSTDKVNPNTEVAGTLYAFSTVPVAGKLVAAAGTKEKGILANTTELHADSEEAGKALLEPSGLTVSPTTHEVMILGTVDKGAGNVHLALARIKGSDGKIEPSYEDPTPVSEEAGSPHSPVTSKSGRVYFEEESQILQVPTDFKSAPKPVFSFSENLTKGPFHEELLAFGSLGTFFGGALAISNEGESTGTFFTFAEAGEMNAEGKAVQLVNVALGVKFTEEGEKVKTSELGWTGGVSSEEEKPCAIEFGGGGYTQVAMGNDPNAVFALTSGRGKNELEASEVVKFGPGGKGCPTPKAVGGIEATILGAKIKNPDTTNPVTLSAKVQGANVLSTHWSFGDGIEADVSTPAGQQNQTAEVSHKFAKAGKREVQATIQTDNLAMPEVKVTTTFEVTGPGLKVKDPVSRTVVEGEPVTFEATPIGGEAPFTVQWEANKGGEWKPVPGAESEKLTIEATKVAESGTQYRAKIKDSGKEQATSGAATLTVIAPKAPEVTKNPVNATVTEDETAVFEATAGGAPEPKITWEASSNGVEWSPVPGGEFAKLQLAHVKAAQSGFKYRATFTNEFAKAKHQATSAAATLTVNKRPVPPPPPPLSPPSGPTGQGEVLPEKVTQPPAPKPQPIAKIAGTTLTVSPTGVLAVKISCPAGETICSGTVTLRTLTAVKASVRGATSKASILTLASGSFSVPGGASKTVTLRLSAKARKLLVRSRKLRARATVVAHDRAGASNTTLSTVTLTPAKAKKKH